MSKNNDNRVLSRMGARALTREEAENVGGGGVHTQTACTVTGLKVGLFDGDAGECGWP